MYRGGVQNQAETNSKNAFRPVPVQKFTFPASCDFGEGKTYHKACSPKTVEEFSESEIWSGLCPFVPREMTGRGQTGDGEICGGVLVENASDDFPLQKKLENHLPNFAGTSPPISPKTSPTSLWKSLVLIDGGGGPKCCWGGVLSYVLPSPEFSTPPLTLSEGQVGLESADNLLLTATCSKSQNGSDFRFFVAQAVRTPYRTIPYRVEQSHDVSHVEIASDL